MKLFATLAVIAMCVALAPTSARAGNWRNCGHGGLQAQHVGCRTAKKVAKGYVTGHHHPKGFRCHTKGSRDRVKCSRTRHGITQRVKFRGTG